MKKRYLILAAGLLVLLGLYQIANNRGKAVTAAQKIIAKDNVGDDTKGDITNLINFVHGHTRASISFTLEGSYNRAVTAAEQAAAGGSGNAALYQAAQAACQSKNPVAVATCTQNYVQTHAAPGAQPKAAVLPDKSAYQYNMNAPGWTWDLAGLSLLGAVLLMAVAIYFAVLNASRHASH